MTEKIFRFRWLIIAVMVLAFVPKTVQAQTTIEPVEPSSGDGTVSNPYQIASAGNLYWFANKVNNNSQTSICAVLTADITVNENVLGADGNLNSGKTDFYEWTPIGASYSNRYTGTFDGQGHTISGLYINKEIQSEYTVNFGLFGSIGGEGVIQNVGVEDSYFNVTVVSKKGDGGLCAGGVCGRNEGTITNCYSSGTISGTTRGTRKGAMIGGVCGYNYEGEITNCYNTGTVSGTGDYDVIGGVCGYNHGNNAKITNCHNSGMVSGTESADIGGVCGCNSETIKNCYYLKDENDSPKGIGRSYSYATEDKIEGKSLTEFGNGSVAWLLNENATDDSTTSEKTSSWLQNLSTDGGDKYPVLKAKDDKCIAVIKEGATYTNPDDHVYNNTFADFPDEGTDNLYSRVCDHCKGAAQEDEKKIKGLNGKDGEIVVTKVDNKWKSNQEIVLEDNKENPQNSGYNSPIPFTVKSATYSREMSTSWATLCLPYSISATNSNCTFYTLKSIETDKIVLEGKTGTINAGTPVFVKRNKDDVSIIVFTENDDVEMMQTSEDQTVTNGNMVGTFKMIELNNENDLFIKDSKMWSVWQVAQANKTMKVLPYRAYISNSPSGAPQRSIAVDGEATAISDALDTLNDANAEYYDMSGRRINSLQKGVNIIRSGNKTRKVIIK